MATASYHGVRQSDLLAWNQITWQIEFTFFWLLYLSVELRERFLVGPLSLQWFLCTL